jgi:hypothetical protein
LLSVVKLIDQVGHDGAEGDNVAEEILLDGFPGRMVSELENNIPHHPSRLGFPILYR